LAKKEHEVWRTLESVGELLAESLRASDLAIPQLDEINRIQALVAYIEKRLDGTTNELLIPESLNLLNQTLQNLLQQVQLYCVSRDPHALSSALGFLQQLTGQIALVPFPQTVEELSGLRRAGENLEEFVRKTIVDLTAQKVGLESAFEQERETIRSASLEVQSQKAAIEAALLEFKKDQQQSRESMDSELRTTTERLENSAQSFDSLHRSNEDKRASSFERFQSVQEEKQRAMISKFEDQLTERASDTKERLKDFEVSFKKDIELLNSKYIEEGIRVLGVIETQKSKVEELVGVIGNLGVTSGYQRAATASWIAVVIWQVVAFVGFCGAAWFAYDVLRPAITDNIKWESMLGKIILSVAVTALPTYAARQAEKFFMEAKYNRRLALELAAIGPYLVGLPDSEQHNFKIELGKRAFGGQTLATPNEPQDFGPVNGLLDTLTKMVATILKSK